MLVKIQDCAAEHDAEVYARQVVRAIEFPGDEALGRRADAYCNRALLSEVGGETAGGLEVWHAVPTARSRAQDDLDHVRPL